MLKKSMMTNKIYDTNSHIQTCTIADLLNKHNSSCAYRVPVLLQQATLQTAREQRWASRFACSGSFLSKERGRTVQHSTDRVLQQENVNGGADS